MNEELDLTDMFMANGLMLEAFMLQVSLELAKEKPDPADWAKEFVTTLHSRIDANEIRTDDRRYPYHELSRQGFDRLGSALKTIIDLDKTKNR